MRAGRTRARGAYACPALECLTGALRKGRLDHAFRRPTEPPAAESAGMASDAEAASKSERGQRGSSERKGETLWRDG